MAKYHLNSKGEAKLCRALKGQCPFGSEQEHHASREAAQSAYEASQQAFPESFPSPAPMDELGQWTATEEMFTVGDRRLRVISEGFYSGASREWWLSAPNSSERVAYLKTLTYNAAAASPEHSFVVCDVEVRESARGQGHGRALLELASKMERRVLHSSGAYTPEGFAAFGNRLPLMPGSEEPGIRFNSMTFVEDWAAEDAEFPL